MNAASNRPGFGDFAEELRGRRVFVTGATGLIGKSLCRALCANGAEVVALVRDRGRAEALLPPGIERVLGDMARPFAYPGEVDYLVHAASMTSSRAFVEQPVEVIDGTQAGIRNAIGFAREKAVKGMVFLSTMEIYGLTDSEDVAESGYAGLDPMSPRNCYPEAKRLAECLCASAAKEYGVPAKVARLTQTFGEGVDANDGRVFAEFARAAAEGRDIVLKSEGKTARCYCSVGDAVSAIQAILLHGEPGMAYNVANPDTYCTIREMAEFVAREFSGGRSKVVVDLSGAEARGYLPPFRMRLNVDRLRSLGWEPREGLREMFAQVVAEMRARPRPAAGDPVP